MEGTRRNFLAGRWIGGSSRIFITLLICFGLDGTRLLAQEQPQSINTAAAQSTSNDSSRLTPQQRATIVKAARAISNEAALAKADYLAAYAPLTNPPILNMAFVTNKIDLCVRETKVKEFIVAARRFQDFCDHFMEHAEAQMRTNIPDESIRNDIIEELPSFYDRILSQAMIARQAEIMRAEDYLKALKLLEDNWGQWQWKTNELKPYVVGGHEFIVQFNYIINDINTLRAESVKAQHEAVKDMKETSQKINE